MAKSTKSFWVAGVFLVTIVILSFAKEFFLPLILSIVLSLALRPLVRGLQRLYIPPSIGAGIVLIATLGIMGMGVYQLYEPAVEWIEKAPTSLRVANKRLNNLLRPVKQVHQIADQMEQITSAPSNQREVEVKDQSLREQINKGAENLVIIGFLVLILLYFLLAMGDKFLIRLSRMMLPTKVQEEDSIVQNAERLISRYLVTITTINILLGVTVGLVFYLLGMPNPFLWGALATLVNFVPYLGPFLGGIIITLASILTFPSVTQALLLPLAYFLLTAIEGLLITPTILGKRFAINPLVVVIWLFFWGWLWGIPGALLAIPLLTIFKIITEYHPTLEPIGKVLSRT